MIRIAREDAPGVVLVTPRLVLRRFVADDWPLLAELDSDPEVVRYINGGEPAKPELDRTVGIPRMLAMYDAHPGFGTFAAHRRDSGAYIGWFHFRPDMRGDPRDADLGYRLMRDAWGQGLATEGSRALVEHGVTLGVRRVVAYALVANRASTRVMEKLGMIPVECFEETRFPGSDRHAVKYVLDSAQPIS